MPASFTVRALACALFLAPIATAQVVASVQVYDVGCPCLTTTRTPVMALTGVPTIGNQNFAFRLLDAPAFALAAVFIGQRNDIDFGCPWHVGGQFFSVTLFTDLAGRVTVGARVPADPGVIGLTFEAQWAVVDGGSALLGLGCASPAAHLVAGT